MPKIAGIYQCSSGLFLIKEAPIQKMCEGCYFASRHNREDEMDHEGCRKNHSLPSCEHTGTSIIYIKLGDK